MKLTRGKLLRQDDWADWQESEFLQLNQYISQGMFGDPVAIDVDAAMFHLVRTYAIKALDRRKKARCVCDGSSRSGLVQILDETYANCVDQTSSRLFYAIAAAENMLIYGSDVSNAFAEAPPPKQGFFVRPDRAFHGHTVILFCWQFVLLSVLPKEQELIPEYGVNIFRPCVRASVRPPTDKCRVCILCVKQHSFLVF
jgi:hypothetical protein